VFRDIDNIPFGIDFRKVINDALRDTDLLIAIVGPNWRGKRKRGNAKIDDDNDLVRIEIETALQRDIPVIPALVGGAVMPKPYPGLRGRRLGGAGCSCEYGAGDHRNPQ
jgi:hypothetical protein